jgi:hypothetical protein
MALVIKDRVKETSTTTGTGTLTLAGATTGYQSFSTAIGNTNTTYYTISTPTGSEWEVGLGTVGAGTLARTSILASSNGGSAVNFSAGVKDVFGTYPAGKAVYSDIESDITINGLRVGKGGGAVATATALGFQALNATNTGTNNTAVGYQALPANTSGVSNTVVGSGALRVNTTGSYNTAIGAADSGGFEPLRANTTASNNTAVGSGALGKNTTGALNAAFGFTALRENTTSSSSTGLGYQAGFAVTGAQNTLVGNRAGYSGTNDLTTGSNNTIIGYLAAASSATVSNEITLGNASVTSLRVPGIAATFGTDNSTISTLTVGKGGGAVATNTALGASAMAATATGTLNTAVGQLALTALTSGNNNTGVGRATLYTNTTASDNTAVGLGALFTNNGGQNTAIGSISLTSNTLGANNTGIGYGSLTTNTTGGDNTASGRYALRFNVTGNFNTAVGSSALLNNTASNNTGIGYNAGQAVTSGAQNTLLGASAGASGTNNLTTGSNNTIIGYNAAASAATVSNEVTIGNSSVTSLRIPGVNLYGTSSKLLVGSATSPSGGSATLLVAANVGGGVQLANVTGSNGALINSVPGSGIAFYGYTGAIGSETYTERMRMTSNGGLSIGNTTDPGAGNLSVTGNILSNGATGAIGYATGSGGAVTQATSRTTGVTLNKTNGAITLVSAAGLATYQSFTVTNSTVAATDTIIVNQKSGTDKYIILITAVAAGSFQITFATTGGTTTEQPVFNFAVIKAVTA